MRLREDTRFHEFLRKGLFHAECAAKLGHRSRESLLRLAVKGRIHDRRIYEEGDRVLDLARLEVHLLLRGELADIAEDMALDRLYVFATLTGVDAVDEGDVAVLRSASLVIEEHVRQNGCDFPTRATAFIGKALFSILAEEETDELFKGVGLEFRIVPEDLDLFADKGCEFQSTRVKNSQHVRVEFTIGTFDVKEAV